MSDFTEAEFNRAMAELKGLKPLFEDLNGNYYIDASKTALWNPNSDLNQLMPIAWRYGIEVDIYPDEDADCRMWIAETIKTYPSVQEAIDKDPVEAIRQCLSAIYQESKP